MHAPIAPHYPQCDSLIERMIELRMELSRKPSNNQDTQQKKLGNQAVGKMAKEPRGSYFGCSQEGSEKLKETAGEVKLLRGTSRSTTVRFCQEERKSFGSEQKSFEEEEKFFSSGDLEEVTCDVLPGVSAVSLSCPVFQKKHQAIRGVVCACWIYDVKIVQSSIFVWRASPFCVHAIDNNWLFYSKGLFKLHQKRDDRAFWRSSQTKLNHLLNCQGRGQMMVRGHWEGNRYVGDLDRHQHQLDQDFLELRATTNPYHRVSLSIVLRISI